MGCLGSKEKPQKGKGGRVRQQHPNPQRNPQQQPPQQQQQNGNPKPAPQRPADPAPSGVSPPGPGQGPEGDASPDWSEQGQYHGNAYFAGEQMDMNEGMDGPDDFPIGESVTDRNVRETELLREIIMKTSRIFIDIDQGSSHTWRAQPSEMEDGLSSTMSTAELTPATASVCRVLVRPGVPEGEPNNGVETLVSNLPPTHSAMIQAAFAKRQEQQGVLAAVQGHAELVQTPFV